MTSRPSKLLAGALLVLLLVACGDDGTGPDGPRAIREGTWTGSAEFGSWDAVWANGTCSGSWVASR
jgi:hypothetical protein